MDLRKPLVLAAILLAPGPVALAQGGDEQAVIAFVEQHLPEHAAMLRQMQAEDPAQYQVELRSFQELSEHYRHVRSLEPQLADDIVLAVKLEHQTQALGEGVAQAREEAEKDGLRQELRQKLTRIFEVRLAEKELEVRLLQEEINAFKAMLERRKELMDQIVERRFQEILGSASEETRWW